MIKPSLPSRRLLPALGERLARVARPPGAVPAGLNGMQPTLDDILTEAPPPFLRSTHYLLAVLFLSLIVVASVVKVDMIVSAAGRLTTDAPLIAVQLLPSSVER